MDKITQRLFAGLFGTAAIIFAFAFLIRSASPAQADTAPQTTYSTGKYMMEMQAEVSSSGTMYWYVLVWNTETGRSKFYFNSTSQKELKAAGREYNLPTNPL